MPRERMQEFARLTYRRELEALATRKANKKDSTHQQLSKTTSRMPRIGGPRNRRVSLNNMESGNIAKKRAQARANTAHAGMVGSRSTPALGGQVWG